MSAALVVVGVFLVVILVIAVRRSRVRRRDETPEDWLIRAKRDQEKSRKWLAGGYGAAVGIWAAGVANGGGGCGGGGGGDGGGGCGGGGCGGGGCGGGGCGGG
jgi:Glycine rich protein family